MNRQLITIYNNLIHGHEADRVLTQTQLRNLITPVVTTGLIISATAFVLSIVSSAYYSGNSLPQLTPQVVTSLIMTTILWVAAPLSRRYPTQTAFVFIITVLLASLNGLSQYGLVTPQPLLAVAICILGSGVLINKYIATLLFLSAAGFIVLISAKQIAHPENIPVVWSNTAVTWGDTLLLIVTLACIYGLTGIYSKENKRSLRRAINLEVLTKGEIQTLKSSSFQGDDSINVNSLIALKEKVGGTFHDVINPLSGISLALESLMSNDNLSKDEVEEMMSSSAQNIQIASTLIHSLREELNNAPKLKEWFSPINVLSEIKIGLAYPLRKEGVSLVVSGDENILLYGDRLSFNRICSNLIINSREAFLRQLSSHEKTITVNLLTNEKQLIINFFDNAGGVPKGLRPHIFTSNFSTKKQSGSGLGLSFVRNKLREEYDGKIELTPKKGGTVFSLQIDKHGDNVVLAR